MTSANGHGHAELVSASHPFAGYYCRQKKRKKLFLRFILFPPSGDRGGYALTIALGAACKISLPARLAY